MKKIYIIIAVLIILIVISTISLIYFITKNDNNIEVISSSITYEKNKEIGPETSNEIIIVELKDNDMVFGEDAGVRTYYDYDEIKIGDLARINNNMHTVFIIDKTDDYIVVAECNADYRTCRID